MTLMTLASVTDFVLDGTHGTPERVPQGVPLYSAQHIRDGRLHDDTTDFTTETEYVAFRRRIQPTRGDVLLTIVGTIGRAAVLEDAPKAVFQRSVGIIRPRADVLDSRYLFHATQSRAFRDQLRKATNQSSQAGVYLGRLKTLQIPLPSLPEQRRIAAILDKAEWVRGQRLAAQALLNTVGRAVFREMFGSPVTDTKRWTVLPLGTICRNEDARRVPLKSSERDGRPGPYPYYGASGVIDSIDDYLFDGPRLLIAEDGANLLARSTPIAFVAHGRYWVNNHAHVLAASDSIDLRFLEFFINSTDLLPFTTGTAQPKLTRASLDRIPITIPPMALQRQFSARLQAIDALSSSCGQAYEVSETLLKSLQHRAFAGEL